MKNKYFKPALLIFYTTLVIASIILFFNQKEWGLILGAIGFIGSMLKLVERDDKDIYERTKRITLGLYVLPLFFFFIGAIIFILLFKEDISFLTNINNQFIWWPLLCIMVLLFVLIINLGNNAKRSFYTSKYIVEPLNFWRVIFNELPTKFENEDISKILVLIVYENETTETTELYEKIKKNYSDDTAIKILGVACNDTNEKELRESIDNKNIAGIYLLYSKNIRQKAWPAKLCQEWAQINKEKPIVYVDLTGGLSNNLNFGKVSLEEADNGLWRLFVRSSKRAKLWEEQTKIVSNYLVYVIIGFIIFISFLISSNNVLISPLRKYKKNTEKINMSDLSNKLLPDSRNFHEHLISNVDTNEYEKFNEEYNKLPEYFLNELLVNAGIEDQKTNVKMTFWKKKADSIFAFASSENKEPERCFALNGKSIIGCAFENNFDFILWSSIATDNAPAVWHYDGDVEKVTARMKSGKIIYDESQSKCNFDKDELIGALLCFAIEDQDEETGVCIDVRGTTQPDFLYEKWVRKSILNYLITMHIFFPTKALEMKCREEKK